MTQLGKGVVLTLTVLVVVLQLEVAWLLREQNRVMSVLHSDGFTFSQYVALRDWAQLKGLSLAFDAGSGVSIQARDDGSVEGRFGAEGRLVRIEVSPAGEPAIRLISSRGAIFVGFDPGGPVARAFRANGESAWELK